MPLPALSYSRLFLHVDTYNHNRPFAQLHSSFSSLLFSPTLDLLISAAFTEVQVATISHSTLSLHRQLVRGIREGLFQIPAVFKVIRIYPLFSSVFPMLGCLSPLSYLFVDQRVDTNRGCIQRAPSLFLSFTLPPSIPLHFPPFHVHIPQSSQLLSLYSFTHYSFCCIVAPTTVVYTAKCALLAKRGKALPQRKAAVSGAASFYVLRLIVNTQPTPSVYTFIYSSASYARRLPFRSAFVRTSWPSIAVAAAKVGCSCRLVHGKELPI